MQLHKTSSYLSKIAKKNGKKEKNNPFAICNTSVGTPDEVEGTKKETSREHCILDIKGKNRSKKKDAKMADPIKR
jgi:hypothetical protein